MIEFKSQNHQGEIKEWKYNSAAELEEAWRGLTLDIPANDDPIFDVVIDGKEDLREATFERIGTDTVWFEDLLTHLGIDIWGLERTPFEKMCDELDKKFEKLDAFAKDFFTWRAIQRMAKIYSGKAHDLKADMETDKYKDKRDYGYQYYLENVLRLLPYLEEDFRSDLFGG